jgi:hypothetical protein
MPFKPLTALVLAWLAGLPAAFAAEQMPVDLELLLAIDISGSIDADEARLQREGYARALIDKDVIKAIKGGIHGKIAIAYFDWSDSYVQNEILDWTLIHDEASARAVSQRLLDQQTRTARRTSISGAINHAIPRFGAGPFKGIRRVLDISGDGPNNDGGPVDLIRDKALAAGIVINGLPIMNGKQNTWGFPMLEDLDRYYEGCVIGGPGSFVVVAENFETFHEAVRRKLILEIATAPMVPPAWQRIGPPVSLKAQSGYRYPKGCDIGERQSQEFWRRRFDQ